MSLGSPLRPFCVQCIKSKLEEPFLAGMEGHGSTMVLAGESSWLRLHRAEDAIPEARYAYVLSGYRNGLTWKQALASAFWLHNETWNVWTHLIGFSVFVWLLVYSAIGLTLPLDLHPGDPSTRLQLPNALRELGIFTGELAVNSSNAHFFGGRSVLILGAAAGSWSDVELFSAIADSLARLQQAVEGAIVDTAGLGAVAAVAELAAALESRLGLLLELAERLMRPARAAVAAASISAERAAAGVAARLAGCTRRSQLAAVRMAKLISSLREGTKELQSELRVQSEKLLGHGDIQQQPSWLGPQPHSCVPDTVAPTLACIPLDVFDASEAAASDSAAEAAPQNAPTRLSTRRQIRTTVAQLQQTLQSFAADVGELAQQVCGPWCEPWLSQLGAAGAAAMVAGARGGGAVDSPVDPAFKSSQLERWPLYVFVTSTLVCLAASSLYHLVGTANAKYTRALAMCDYSGIIFLIYGSCVPFIYYGFYHSSLHRNGYLVVMSALAGALFFCTQRPFFYNAQWRLTRIFLFVALGMSGGLPLVHIQYVHSFSPLATALLWRTAQMGCLYLIGVAIYASGFPESLVPFAFDIHGNSHQWWHLLIIAAALVHFQGVIELWEATAISIMEQSRIPS